MTRSLTYFAAALLFLIVIAAVSPRAEAGVDRIRRNAYGDNYAYGFPSGGDGVSQDLLQELSDSPDSGFRDKRNWCRPGMIFNPVLHRCTLSYAAIRNRGRA